MSNYLSIKDIVESVSITHKFDKPSLIFLNTSDVERGKIISTNYFPTSELKGQAKKTIQKDDILFSEIRPKNRRFAYIDFDDTNDYVVSTKLMVLRNKNPKVDNRYFYYFLTNDSMLNLLQNRAENRICSFPQITFDLLGEYKIRIPALDEQKKITRILTALDSKIELNNRINAELEAMAKTLYDYWFVQFDYPDSKGKPYKTSGGKMVWNKELKREIPLGWGVESIEYYADVIDPHPSHRAPTEVINGFPFAGIGDIDENGNIDLDKARVINEEFVIKQERDYSITEFSIGYGRVGTVGKVVKLRKQRFRFALSPTMAIINPKYNTLPSFVYFSVKNPIFLQWVAKYTSGSTRPAIGIQHLRTIPVIKPQASDLHLLEKFELVAKNSLIQSDVLNKQNQNLIELRNWLLPMLMNGQVIVN